MYVRLAFAVAAHLEPDILLLDEVLAVGDLAVPAQVHGSSRASCSEQDATILFVSHNMFSIKTMCSRVIYLQQGQIEFDGPTDARHRDVRARSAPERGTMVKRQSS